MVNRTQEGFGLSHAAILNGTTGVEEVFGDIYGIRTGTIAADVGNYDNTGDDFVLSSWFWINFATVTVEAGYMPLETMALLAGERIVSDAVSAVEFTPAGAGTSKLDYSTTNSSTFTLNGKSVNLNSNYGSFGNLRDALMTQLNSGGSGNDFVVTRNGKGLIRVETAAPSTAQIVVAGTDAADLTGSTGYYNGPGLAAGNESFSMLLWSEKSVNQPPRPMLIRVPGKDRDGITRTLDFVLFRVQFGPFTFSGPAYRSGLLLNYSGRAVLSSVDEAGNQLYDAQGCATRAIGRIISRPAAAVC